MVSMLTDALMWAVSQNPDCTGAAIIIYAALGAAGDIKAQHKHATLTGQGELAGSGDPTYAGKVFDEMAGARSLR